MKKTIRIKVGIFLLLLISSCEGFLDPKPDQSMLVPSTLADVRSLLDNVNIFNKQPALPILAGDEFMVSDAGYNSLSETEQQIYSWSADPYPNNAPDEWSIGYKQVFYANIALDALESIEPDTQEYKKLRGEALFHKAHGYYHLLQQFAPAFRKDGGNDRLVGIVLKESPDINEPAVRATLMESYSEMIADLEEAATLLPESQLPKTRPTKAIAYALLGRIYLITFDYAKAVEAAEMALDIYNERLDFNEIEVNSSTPFSKFGDEMVFYSEILTLGFMFSNEVSMDTLLMKSYNESDLRLPVFFDAGEGNKYLYTGKLSGNLLPFGGLSVGELELIAAEGNARLGNEVNARSWINGLLSRRIATSDFIPIESVGTELLDTILDERRKELVGRGLRWSDLRRLNQEPEYEKMLSRSLNGEVLTLDPNSDIYVFLIPDAEIQRSGIYQNR